jgi:prepilin-type N-terminal cleavage/methylation domain-containing protein
MHRKREAGFTLVEVMVAIAILSFAIFATLRVITASLNSINRQGQRGKALHLAQAHLVELETKFFSRIVPETWTITGTGDPLRYVYQLNIYDANVSPSETLVSSDDDYWYDSDGLGFSPNDNEDDGILVVSGDGTTVYTCENDTASETDGPGTPPADYNWDTDDSKLFFDTDDQGKEIQIYYRYYHLIKEGGTIPMFDGDGFKKGTIKLITSVGDTDGNDAAGEKSDIMGDNLTDDAPLSPSDYESFNSQTKELTFADAKAGSSVYIYYLSKKGTDIDGDGCEDPLDDAILGVVEGSFYNPDGSTIPNQITSTKKVTVTEYWKQGENIQSTRQEAYINK